MSVEEKNDKAEKENIGWNFSGAWKGLTEKNDFRVES